MRVEYTPGALADLGGIGVHIADQGAPVAAARLVGKIIDACEARSLWPERFVLAPEFGANVRRIVIDSYLPLYVADSDRLRIVSIRHRRRKRRRLVR